MQKLRLSLKKTERRTWGPQATEHMDDQGGWSGEENESDQWLRRHVAEHRCFHSMLLRHTGNTHVTSGIIDPCLHQKQAAHGP